MVSSQLNPVPTAGHFRRIHQQSEHSCLSSSMEYTVKVNAMKKETTTT